MFTRLNNATTELYSTNGIQLNYSHPKKYNWIILTKGNTIEDNTICKQ
jgi:hypothetical protein